MLLSWERRLVLRINILYEKIVSTTNILIFQVRRGASFFNFAMHSVFHLVSVKFYVRLLISSLFRAWPVGFCNRINY